MLLPLALIVGILGRGHFFQEIGLALPCEDMASVEVEPEPHDRSGGASSTHEHCPNDCHRCPCGQMPVVPPIPVLVSVAVLGFLELPESTLLERPGRAHPRSLDHPPRRHRA